ncbi:SusD/RagB family nutrient-binding outer membrane lipoprotein [Lutibacter maritimus]|uniref:Susd and RagB outer membrane lipoprotein n=1 Tax=Lutibacter maritimus TaxID=593133 RepID=A0A1I6RDG5_9FLAO|nr:SusD/RagB family nutrient-binding outer membrane lipoprotein [Lutibacter maritimus]SFS62695.1 Susd and RagB outer membrane lipoprotein [Lutibacter maritimus]
MKKMLKKIGFHLMAVGLLVSCSDFEDMNVDPTAASVDQVQVEYFINSSIIGAQQDPNIAERVFVLYWKDAGRMDRIGSLSEGYYSEDWSSQYYTYVSRWLKDINTAVRVADEQIESGNSKAYTNNLKQIARIWRAYLMSEMADNFGPMPIDGFQGINPDYNSVKDVYYFILDELREASNSLELDVNNPDNLKNGDPAYGYNYTKWKQYANSLRMRFAMRLSEVDAAKAKTEFEDAVSGSVYISLLDDNFAVQEKDGWNDLAGVMSREWNSQYLSATSNNLMIGLGGVTSESMLSADKHSYIKPANYIGLKYDDHFTTLTNDPSAGFWFDGLHNSIDPRAYDAYPIPGDFDNPEFNKYPSWASNATTTKRNLLDDAGNTLQEIEAAFTWNAPATGDWGEKGSKNRLYWYQGTLPRLASKYRNSTMKRVFFGSWESYFLIAEAAVKGWNVPMSGKSAYEEGIRQSFSYSNVSAYVDSYLTSENYNRVGTSVSWNHTAEPPATVVMNYIDGYTGTPGTYNFKYPSNTIYQGGSVKNDLLTKIITQKFIAQTPWLPLETWNDHRRLGLPFFENPAIENLLPDSPNLTLGNYMTNSVKVFPQRLKYPSGISNNVPKGYKQAVEFLEGPDNVFTPLWWAKH